MMLHDIVDDNNKFCTIFVRFHFFFVKKTLAMNMSVHFDLDVCLEFAFGAFIYFVCSMHVCTFPKRLHYSLLYPACV